MLPCCPAPAGAVPPFPLLEMLVIAFIAACDGKWGLRASSRYCCVQGAGSRGCRRATPRLLHTPCVRLNVSRGHPPFRPCPRPRARRHVLLCTISVPDAHGLVPQPHGRRAQRGQVGCVRGCATCPAVSPPPFVRCCGSTPLPCLHSLPPWRVQRCPGCVHTGTDAVARLNRVHCSLCVTCAARPQIRRLDCRRVLYFSVLQRACMGHGCGPRWPEANAHDCTAVAPVVVWWSWLVPPPLPLRHTCGNTVACGVL
jgi:hypothetical protein